jgi:hypothetical protein
MKGLDDPDKRKKRQLLTSKSGSHLLKKGTRKALENATRLKQKPVDTESMRVMDAEKLGEGQ